MAGAAGADVVILHSGTKTRLSVLELTEQEKLFGRISTVLLEDLFCSHDEVFLNSSGFAKALSAMLVDDTESLRRELPRFVSQFAKHLCVGILGPTDDDFETLSDETRLVIAYRLYVGYRKRTGVLLSEQERAFLLGAQSELSLSNQQLEDFLRAVGQELVDSLLAAVDVNDDE